jgi:hypothetical protein
VTNETRPTGAGWCFPESAALRANSRNLATIGAYSAFQIVKAKLYQIRMGVGMAFAIAAALHIVACGTTIG